LLINLFPKANRVQWYLLSEHAGVLCVYMLNVSYCFVITVSINYAKQIYCVSGSYTKLVSLAWLHSYRKLNWWKGKPSGSIACTRKKQLRIYWCCSSVEMKDATLLTPPSALPELFFKMLTTYNPWSLKTSKI